jgi:hypothetical protein
MGIKDLLRQMGQAEQDFLRTQFVAPVTRHGKVHVRIAGIVCEFKVDEVKEEGWFVCAPLSYKRAIVRREAKRKEIADYLKLFPLVRVIACDKQGDRWLGLPANATDPRIKVQGVFPILLANSLQLFQVVLTRLCGGHFLFERVDTRRDPTIAEYLRKSLKKLIPPAELSKPGLIPEERAAYGWQFNLEEEKRVDKTQRRLEKALQHAGARLESYVERKDAYTVTYTVDDMSYRSTIGKDDLRVVSAGICLSGEDEKFDLQSLVGVLREAQQREHDEF